MAKQKEEAPEVEAAPVAAPVAAPAPEKPSTLDIQADGPGAGGR